jgi:hypothetical protein
VQIVSLTDKVKAYAGVASLGVGNILFNSGCAVTLVVATSLTLDPNASAAKLPPTFSLLYKKFDKPIIIVAPIRYEAPFWDKEEKWKNFNEYLFVE